MSSPPGRTALLAPGFEISRVLVGLWQIADMERDGRSLDLDRAAEAMLPYVADGLTTFDMADHYGSAEDIAGRFRAAHGDQPVQLLTKWVPPPGPVTREQVRAAVERSLRRLRTDALDLLQFHAWRYADPAWLDCLFWLDELRREGLIRQLGLTNFDTAHLRIAVASGISIVSNQVCLSLLDRRPLARMTAFCADHGIALLCYGTVAGGLLTERWLGRPDPGSGDGGLTTWSEMKYRRFIETAGGWAAYQRLLEAVAAVARRHGVSMANVACRYVLDLPAVGGIIIGARLGEREHRRENLRVFDLALDPASRKEIELALDGLVPIPGEPGDEYRKPPYLTASGDLSHHLDAFPPPYPTRIGADGRSLVLSGTDWEALAGYSRAVRQGHRLLVSGTTATHRDRAIGGRDPAAQAHFAIDKVEGALLSLGSRLEDVVRTRVYVRRLEDWEPVARAHGERFGAISPANTLVQAGLIGEDYLVEVEAEALRPRLSQPSPESTGAAPSRSSEG